MVYNVLSVHFHVALLVKNRVQFNCPKIYNQQYSTELNMYRFPEFIHLILYNVEIPWKNPGNSI